MIGCATAGAAGVTDLRCEFLRDPLGIDAQPPRLGWIMDSEADGAAQTAYRVLVASDLKTLNTGSGDLWDSGRVASDQSSLVPYEGKPLGPRAACWWKVKVWDQQGRESAWSEPAHWSMGPEWAQEAKWLGCDWMHDGGPLPWLRKTFDLPAKPARAEISVCALGYFELYVNGEKVGDDVLAPATSDYAKRGLYITYDIADRLKPGKNCLGLWLGRGWSKLILDRANPDGPVARAQLDVSFASGKPTRVVTDDTWKAQKSCITPIDSMQSGHYGGETLDARLETDDWSKPDFDDSRWSAAKVFTPPTPVIAAQPVETNRIIGRIEPVSIEPLGSGYLVDMGRNYSGWFKITLPELKDGQEVHMEFADKRFPDGTFQTYSQRDTYIGRAGGHGTFCNRFNYHAFRYALIKGVTNAPKPSDIVGLPISTNYERIAEFECSNPLLNNIYNTILWTYRCLSLGGYTVDCPHRERLGYGGDSGTSMEMGMTNFALAPFYSKWAADWRDSQNEAGDVPYTAPSAQYAGGGPVWSGFCITMPWQVYVQFGDRRILEKSYPIMKKWLAFIDTKFKDGILQHYVGIGCNTAEWSFLGDWVPPGRKQGADGRVDARSTLFFNNCYLVHCLQLASKVAALMNDGDNARAYAEKAETLAARIHEQFLNPGEATYVNREQPYLAMPLLFNVTPESMRTQVLDSLANDILVTHKGHLNSGMHGTYYMAKYLMQNGRNDLVYSMVSQDTYPSWGYMLKNGATTIWEEWDGDNSQIHNTLISIGMWFIQGLGGIRWDEKEPGYKHVVINPGVVDGLDYVKSSYRSPYGKIVSNWTKKDGKVAFDITVPANSYATIMLPNKETITMGAGHFKFER